MTTFISIASADKWWVDTMAKDFSKRERSQRVAAWGLTDQGFVVPLAGDVYGRLTEVTAKNGQVLQVWHEDGNDPPPRP